MENQSLDETRDEMKRMFAIRDQERARAHKQIDSAICTIRENGYPRYLRLMENPEFQEIMNIIAKGVEHGIMLRDYLFAVKKLKGSF